MYVYIYRQSYIYMIVYIYIYVFIDADNFDFDTSYIFLKKSSTSFHPKVPNSRRGDSQPWPGKFSGEKNGEESQKYEFCHPFGTLFRNQNGSGSM